MINNMAGLSFFRSNKGKRKNDKAPPQTKNVLKDTSSNISNTFLKPTSVDVAVSFFSQCKPLHSLTLLLPVLIRCTSVFGPALCFL